jgi:hypothetical protein
MYNYTNYVSSNDRFGHYGTDEYKLNYLSRKLKYPLEDIIRAVQEVGFDKEEVEEYIRDRYNRS